MTVNYEVNMIQMPNFLTYKTPPGLKQDGFKEAPSIPVGTLTKSQAAEYAEEMRKAFLAHWETLNAGR